MFVLKGGVGVTFNNIRTSSDIFQACEFKSNYSNGRVRTCKVFSSRRRRFGRFD